MTRVLLSALLLFSIHAAANAAPPVYRVIDIGSFAGSAVVLPSGLNSSGVVVGNTEQSGRLGRAYAWSADQGIHKIHVSEPDTSPLITAVDINDGGQILGASNDGGPTGGGGIVIREADGSLNYFVEGTWVTERPKSIVQITNGGKVLGQSYWRGSYTSYPWIWSPEQGLMDISAIGRDGFSVYQMNDSGRVVGVSYNCDLLGITAFAFDVRTQQLHWLDPHRWTCRYSTATAVNDAGDVVGWASTAGAPERKPFLWNETDGLRMLPGRIPRDWIQMKPTDINNTKQVVGRFSRLDQWLTDVYFYWDEASGFHDLRHLLDPDDPMSEQVVLSDGKGIITAMYTPKINDRGMILVAGSLRSDRPINRPQRTFLLVPVAKE